MNMLVTIGTGLAPLQPTHVISIGQKRMVGELESAKKVEDGMGTSTDAEDVRNFKAKYF